MSLTSNVRRTMQRQDTNRLRYFAESMHLLTENQAGFRNGHSTEDQLLRLSQSISDGSQQSPMQHTVVALIDYSRAYDKVWRDALLMKMSHKGIPSHVVRWIQAWLSNRLTWVTFDGARSQTVTLKQGIQQGSVPCAIHIPHRRPGISIFWSTYIAMGGSTVQYARAA